MLMRLFVAYFAVVPFLPSILSELLHPTPYVSWSMDNRSNATLLPNYNSAKSWIVDLQTTTTAFAKGVKGQAIKINGSQCRFLSNIARHECIVNTSNCKSGITISFWLNIESSVRSRRNLEWPVLRTSNEEVYIAVNATHMIYCIGYEKYITRRIFKDGQWIHISVAWTPGLNNLAVYENKTKFLVPSTNTTMGQRQPSSQPINLILGKQGAATFLIDELEVYYRSVDPDTTVSTPPGRQSPNYKMTALMVTLIPAALILTVVLPLYWFFKKRRTRNTLNRYFRQSSADLLDDNDDQPEVNYDANDERSDFDSESDVDQHDGWLIGRDDGDAEQENYGLSKAALHRVMRKASASSV